jgi:IclR family mhp operon transcriptional activator
MGVTTDALGVARAGGRQSVAATALTNEPAVARQAGELSARSRCRTNSRRGLTDPEQRSYPPVESVCRAFDVLRTVNKFRIASVTDIYEETGFPKPTIVRMLETLMAEGYVARDNMCGGYRVTSRVHELNSGYEGISQVIEISRPLAIGLTRRTKWPIGIGVIDGHAIALKFWTGAISPWAHTNTVLGLRPDLVTSAMGRAYLGFCSEHERDRQLRWLRADRDREFGEAEERCLRMLLDRIRVDGYATRDPRTKPHCTTTLAMPILEGETVHALISISFFTTAIAKCEMAERIVAPLRATTTKIEEAFAFVNCGGLARDRTPTALEFGF